MRRLFCCLLFLPLLSACTNDGAAYLVNGVQQNNISIVRESLLWDKQVSLYVVVSRIPDCQRRHFVQKASPRAHIELWEFKPGEGTYILKIGNELYVTETRTCESFAQVDEHDEAIPDGNLGKQLGTFGLINGVFSFVPMEEPEEESAAATAGEGGERPN
ncbi:hypothetical protein FACS189441_6880 [Betaproteobacteria bacterium]|nr:hypothetical protein FACS189441_6880 [Betaproteobacteria bacterium]